MIETPLRRRSGDGAAAVAAAAGVDNEADYLEPVALGTGAGASCWWCPTCLCRQCWCSRRLVHLRSTGMVTASTRVSSLLLERGCCAWDGSRIRCPERTRRQRSLRRWRWWWRRRGSSVCFAERGRQRGVRRGSSGAHTHHQCRLRAVGRWQHHVRVLCIIPAVVRNSCARSSSSKNLLPYFLLSAFSFLLSPFFFLLSTFSLLLSLIQTIPIKQF
jgi:hypothetical protein